MYLSGVVVPDEYFDDEDVIVADSPGEQIYKYQQYGDDGITAGDEGFGFSQAQALKAKLGRKRRRLGVGRRPWAIGASTNLYRGLGIAPLAIVGSIKPLAGLLKKGSPRYKGGPLVSTVEGKRQGVESGSMVTVQELERLRRGVGTDKKSKGAWASVWNDLLPTWSYNVQQFAYIKKNDPAFRGMPPAPATAVVSVGPTVGPATSPLPVPGPTVDAAGGTAPYFPPAPSPIPQGSAGPVTPSEVVAATVQDQNGGVEVAGGGGGGFGNIDPKLLLIGGAALLFFMQGGKRRR